MLESRRVPINVVDESYRNARQPALPSLADGPRIRTRSDRTQREPRVAQLVAAPTNRVNSEGSMGTRKRPGVLDEEDHPFERRHIVIPPTRVAPPKPQPSFEIPSRNHPNVSSRSEAPVDQSPCDARPFVPENEVPVKHPLQPPNSSCPPSRSRDLPPPSFPPTTVQHTYPPVFSSSQVPGTFRHDPMPSSGPPPLYPSNLAQQTTVQRNPVETRTDAGMPSTKTIGPSSSSAEKVVPVTASTRLEPKLAQRRSQYLNNAHQRPSGPGTDPDTKDKQLRSRKASAASIQSNTVAREPTRDEIPSTESDAAPPPQARLSRVASSIHKKYLQPMKSSVSLRNRRETSGNGPPPAAMENGRQRHPSDVTKGLKATAEVPKLEDRDASKPAEGIASLANNEPAKLGGVSDPSPAISDDDDTSVSTKKRRVGSDGDKVQRSKADDIPSNSDSDASSWAAVDELQTPMKRSRHTPKSLIITHPPQSQNSPLIMQGQEESPVSTIPSSLPTISTFTSSSMPQFGYLAARRVDDGLPKEPVRRGERDGNIPPIVTTAKTRNIARAAAARRFAASTAPRLGIAGVDPLGISGTRNAPLKHPESDGSKGRFTARSRGKSRT